MYESANYSFKLKEYYADYVSDNFNINKNDQFRKGCLYN